MTHNNETKSTDPFLRIAGIPIFFSENWSTGIGGGLWSTGRMMAHYWESPLARRMVADLSREKPLHVLELGSGNGLLSVCFMAMAKDCVEQLVITDMEDHLDLIRRTLAANPHIIDSVAADSGELLGHPGDKPDSSERVLIMEHQWGMFESLGGDNSVRAQVREGRRQFDLILGSDVAYHPSLYKPLIASLQAYFHETTIALIGVTMLDTTVEFFDMLRRSGFCYERIPDALIEPKEYRGTTFGLFLVRQQQPRTLIQYKKRR